MIGDRKMKAVVTNSLTPFFNRLVPHMEQLNRGDVLKDALIEQITGLDVRRLDSRIRKWFFSNGIRIEHRRDGYYLMLDAEQSDKYRDDNRNIYKRSVRAATNIHHVDPLSLTETELRRHEHYICHSKSIVEAHAVENRRLDFRNKDLKRIEGKSSA